MPSRNVIKVDNANSYYHIYARGGNKQPIFLDQRDYRYFEALFARYLSKNPATSKEGVLYPHYAGKLELLTYCLMENHFHLLVYQRDQRAMSKFMSSIMTSYSRYFNLKYKRTGSLFESRYKASHINAQTYLEHISRYIHLNPRYWRRYPYSSLPLYGDQTHPEWLKPAKVLSLFNNFEEYITFLQDYEEHKNLLDELKHELADR